MTIPIGIKEEAFSAMCEEYLAHHTDSCLDESKFYTELMDKVGGHTWDAPGEWVAWTELECHTYDRKLFFIPIRKEDLIFEEVSND